MFTHLLCRWCLACPTRRPVGVLHQQRWPPPDPDRMQQNHPPLPTLSPQATQTTPAMYDLRLRRICGHTSLPSPSKCSVSASKSSWSTLSRVRIRPAFPGTGPAPVRLKRSGRLGTTSEKQSFKEMPLLPWWKAKTHCATVYLIYVQNSCYCSYAVIYPGRKYPFHS